MNASQDSMESQLTLPADRPPVVLNDFCAPGVKSGMPPTTTEWTLSLPPSLQRKQRSSWPYPLLPFSGSHLPSQGLAFRWPQC